jgi:hydrogenase expression/formation protein HypC
MCLAIPGRVESIDPSDPNLKMARVRFGGIVKQVCLAYTPEVTVGDYVIVHVGFAISRLNEEEAQRVFEYARQIGELEQLNEGSAAGSAPVR